MNSYGTFLARGALMKRFSHDFEKVADGHWRCTENATFIGPQGRIQVVEGMDFMRGTTFMGIDVAKWLDDYSNNHKAPPGWRSPEGSLDSE